MRSLPASAASRAVLVVAWALAIGCLASAALALTTVSVQPPAPTRGEAVTLVVFNDCGCPWFGEPFVRNGFTVDVPYGEACLSACLPQTTTYQLGLLEPGTYTVRQFLDGQPSTAEPIGTFVVGEGTAIPALGFAGAAAMVMLLSMVALWRLRSA